MQTAIDYKYLRLIPNPKFNLWDVKRYSTSSSLKFENVIKLSDILTPYKKAVSKEEMIKNKWQIIAKINFGGQLFLREFEEINTYKGNLNLVPENAIIYSKINVRHGCIYFNEKGNTPFGVSSEYPTFTFDETKVNGYFLKKVLRSNEFKRLLNTKTSGISKARVKQDEFLNIEIPLPTLAEQEAIVKAYQSKIQEAQNLEQQTQSLEKEIEHYLFNALGVGFNLGEKIKKGLQTVSYKSIEKWALDDIFNTNSINSNKYELVPLSKVCSLITDGTHQTPKYFESGITFLSAKNVTQQKIDWVNIKYVSQEAHSGYCKRVKPELYDILLAKNGTTGVAAMVDREEEFSIYVSLALLKPIHELIVPEYLLYVINSNLAKVQFNSRLIGIGVPNLHLGEIRETLIPLPPKSEQHKIVHKIISLKNEINSTELKTENLQQQAEQEFERAIFS